MTQTRTLGGGKPRGKKTSKDDAEYKLGSENRSRKRLFEGENRGILAILTDTRTTTIKNEAEVPVATSVLFNPTIFQQAGFSPSAAEKKLQPHLESMPTYRPAIAPQDGTPWPPPTVTTPEGKRVLKLQNDMDAMAFYSNQSPLRSPTSTIARRHSRRLFASRSFMETDAFKALKPVQPVVTTSSSSSDANAVEAAKEQIQKSREIEITKELLAARDKLRRQRSRSRTIPQDRVITKAGHKPVSAKAYLAAMDEEIIDVRIPSHLCHLIGLFLEDEATAQTDENLSIASSACNALQFLLDSQIRSILKNWYPEGFRLRVSAAMIPIEPDATQNAAEPIIYTQIAEIIYWELSTSGFKIKLPIDATTPNKPHISTADIIKYFFITLCELAKEKENNQPAPLPPSTAAAAAAAPAAASAPLLTSKLFSLFYSPASAAAATSSVPDSENEANLPPTKHVTHTA